MNDGVAADPARLIKEVLTVAAIELRSLAVGVRAVLSFVLYGGFALIVSAGYLAFAEKIEEQVVAANPTLANLDKKLLLEEMLKSDTFQQKAMPLLEQLGGSSFASAVAGNEVPWIVIALMLFSSLAIPGLVLVVTYDRISEDLSTKYARFVLQRVHRGSYLLGKILGQWATLLVSVMLVHLVLLGLGVVLGKKVDAGAVLAVLPKVWAAMALFILAYTAFTAVISSLVTPPFGALAAGGMGLMGLFVLKHAIPFFGELWMGSWDTRLWFLEPTAILVYVGHAVVLGGIAFAIVRWRAV